jgi:anti-anti-sigma factor
MSTANMPQTTAALQQQVAELEQQLAVYRSIVAQLSLGLHVYHLEDIDDDRTLRMIDANSAVEALTGVAPERTIGRTLDESFPDLRAQGVPQLYASVIRSGEPTSFEVVYGDEQVIESAFAVRAAPLPGNCLAVSFENITQRKQDERELKRLNDELQQQVAVQATELHLAKASLDRAADAVFWSDTGGKLVYVNDAACANMGYTRAELLERTIADIDSELSEDSLANVFDTVMQHGSAKIESVHRRKDESSFPVEVMVNMLDFDSQRYLISFARDITERKQAEDQLRTFRTLVESAPYSITISNLEGFLTYANPAHQQAHGYEGSAAGMRFDQIMPDPDALNTALGVLTSEGRWQGIMPHKHADGNVFPMQCDAFFVYDQAGTPISAVVIERDVSEEVRQEQEHQALQQQIIDAQQTAIRELSTPLLPISKHVVVMPLVGTIDSQRAQQVMEALLEGISAYHATTVIVDITGVRVVDTQVAQALLQSAQAARLLGAKVFLTGIQPQIAQTLVQLGADLSGIVTHSTLQAGIAQVLLKHRARG